MKMLYDKMDKNSGRNRQHSKKNLWQMALSIVQGIVDVNYSRKGYGAKVSAYVLMLYFYQEPLDPGEGGGGGLLLYMGMIWRFCSDDPCF